MNRGDLPPEDLKPSRRVLELDYFWRESQESSAPPPKKGSSSISLWDEEGQALVARKRDRPRNSDAVLRIQVLRGAPKEVLLQMLQKLCIVLESEASWENLIYDQGNDWQPILPPPEDESAR